MMLRSTLSRDAKVFYLNKMLDQDSTGRQWQAILLVRNLWNMVIDKQTENILLGVDKSDVDVALEILDGEYTKDDIMFPCTETNTE